MAWLARVFASAIVRRIAYLVVAAIAAYFSLGTAHAQEYKCTAPAAKCTEGEAHQEATRYANSMIGDTFKPDKYKACVMRKTAPSTGAVSQLSGCVRSSDWTSGARTFYFDSLCEDQPSYTGLGPWDSNNGQAPNGSIGCRNGCDGMWSSNGDSTMTWDATGGMCPIDPEGNCKKMGAGYVWDPARSVCQPPSPDCPNGQVKNAQGQCEPEPCPQGTERQPDGTCKPKECAPGEIKSPDGQCLPGEGQCAKGEVKGPDGKCHKDADGDGEPDGDDDGDGDGDGDKSFSGGQDCKSPPKCSGDVILCGQARIQWRIQCNTSRNRTVNGGACNAMPICVGDDCDALEYSGLLQQWKAACALENLANGGTGSNPDTAAIRAALTGTGGVVDPGQSNPGSGAWLTPSPGSPGAGQPNTAGYGWGGNCPKPPAFEILGRSYEFDLAPLCGWLSLGSFFVMGLAALGSLRIVAGKES